MKKALFIILIISSFSSCIFNNADHPIVGKYSLFEDGALKGDNTIQFKNEGKFTIVRHSLTDMGEGQKPRYIHYYHTYNGIFQTEDNRLTLFYTDTTYKKSYYIDGNPIDSIVRSDNDFLAYEENALYELSEDSNKDLTLVRDYGTDHSHKQFYKRQYLK